MSNDFKDVQKSLREFLDLGSATMFKNLHKVLTEFWNLGIAVTVQGALIEDSQYLSPNVVRGLPVSDLLTALYRLSALPTCLEGGDLTPFIQHKKVKVLTLVDPFLAAQTTYNTSHAAIETKFLDKSERFCSPTRSFVLVKADCVDLSGTNPLKVQLPILLRYLYAAIAEGWREADGLCIDTVSRGGSVCREINILYDSGLKHSLGPLGLSRDLLALDRPAQDTPLWGSREKNPDGCRCEVGTTRDCGCAFGQCAKGLVY